jgi:hypothetical protein
MGTAAFNRKLLVYGRKLSMAANDAVQNQFIDYMERLDTAA